MEASVVTIADLEHAGRWRVELFIPEKNEPHFSSKWPLESIGSLCTEVNDSVDPRRGTHRFVYLGLENVESITGDLVGSLQKSWGEIKSRCKSFLKGDVLYGRLRPALRKVFSSAAIEKGLCSTEFIVLRPDPDKISAVVLRALLASPSVSAQLTKMQSGAALPRVPSKDLFAIRLPVPDTESQRTIEAVLSGLEDRRRLAKDVLHRAASEFESALHAALI